MDKQQITRQLHRLAQEEIPDTMNLWPRIQGQLKRKAKPRSFSLAHALSVFVMFILVSVGGYAAYQSRVDSPEALTPNEAALLNIVQKGNGVTARLDWAYADANIISLQYTVIYNPQEVMLPDYNVLFLSTGRGQQIPQDYSSGGGGGGGGDNQTFQMTNQVNFDASVIEGNPESIDLLFQIQYGSSSVPTFIPTIPPDFFTATAMPMGEFQPTVPPPDSFTATPIPMGEFQPTVPPFDMAIATSTPYPMGEFQPTALPPEMLTIEPSLIPPVQFTPTPIPNNPIYNFTFSFRIPFHPAKTGTMAANSIEANGLAVEIQNLRITPLMTRFDLCYELPDFAGEWYPKVTLDTDYAPAPWMQSYMATLGLDGESLYMAQLDDAALLDSRNAAPSSLCSPMKAYAPFSSEGGDIEIVVDYLYRFGEPLDEALWAADERFFRERGFDLSYAFVGFSTEAELQAFYSQSQPSNVIVYPLPTMGALLITLRDYPDSMEVWEAQQYLFDNMLRERYEGSWVFQVEVEGSDE